MTDHEERLAAAQHVVERRHAELDQRLSEASAHTAGGIPTSPLSGLHPQEQALYEAKVILGATEDEAEPVEHNPHSALSGHDGYVDARTAIASTNLDQYQGRGAVVTRGTESVCVEVAGTVVAMVRIPADSTEAAERDLLQAYLTPTSSN
jgi:hypothetical protein